MEISRRTALSQLGCLVAGASLGLPASPAYAQQKQTPQKLPWPYHKLDPHKAAERAYKGYFANKCMFGVFDAIIGELADTYGEPYASFPTAMMLYGGSGVAGWGSLCGALNGAAAAIQLLSSQPKKLTSELFAWSERTALPDVTLNIKANEKEGYPASSSVASSVSNSVLCHVIMSKWVAKSGHKIDSPEKKQRCGHFSGDIAKKTVELLNDEIDGKLVFTHPLTEETQKCAACHSGKKSVFKNTQGVMECQSCHEDHTR